MLLLGTYTGEIQKIYLSRNKIGKKVLKFQKQATLYGYIFGLLYFLFIKTGLTFLDSLFEKKVFRAEK